MTSSDSGTNGDHDGALVEETFENTPDHGGGIASDNDGDGAGNNAADVTGSAKKVGEFPGLGPRFQRISILGQGGMGTVYLAEDRQLERHVAVKRIPAASPTAREQLSREARLNAKVKHANVVTIYDVCVVDGAIYIISEYIAGESLERAKPPLPWQQVLDIGLDLARGLAAAHQRGVLHRDIKPANAIRERDSGRAKLIDFGVAELIAPKKADGGDSPHEPPPGRDQPGARHYRRAPRRGTPAYWAPEIWDGREASKASDVYAMGVLLYQLCTGDRPIWVDDPARRGTLRLHGDSDDIDARLVKIVNRCLEPEPYRRYSSGEELAGDLAALRAAPARVRNPYRGLLPFQVYDEALFFGREADGERVIADLRAKPFVLLFGDSGVGKSSLAAAGVLPAVTGGRLDPERVWQTEMMVPGQRPWQGLRRVLARSLGRERESVRGGEDGFSALVADLHRHHGRDRGLVLFIDQLEELVTISEHDEALAADALLGYLIEQNLDSVRILAAVRNDHLPRIADLAALGPLVGGHLHLVRTLGPDGLRRAIAEPAAKMGVSLADELVADLIQATVSASGGLPLLQFALAMLWDARDAAYDIIKRDALERIGGFEGALARRADEVLDEIAQGRLRQVVRRILVRLVTLDRTRARATREELVGDDTTAIALLEQLVKHRLLVCHLADGHWVYAYAHEALMHLWPTLRNWLDEEREMRAIHARLIDAALEWQRLGRPREALWGQRQLQELARIDTAELSELDSAFIAASRRMIFWQRWRWPGILALVITVAAATYVTGEMADRRQLQSEIEELLAQADDEWGKAQTLQREFFDLRQRALGLMATERGPQAAPWKKLWQQALQREAKLREQYQSVSATLERAFARAPGRADVASRLSELLHAWAHLADVTGHARERDQLRSRLAVVDPERAEAWTAPVVIAVRTEPPGAEIDVFRYVDDASGPMQRERVAKLSESDPGRIELSPGSYLVHVREGDGRIGVRYPIQLHRDHARDNYSIDIKRPLRSAIPEGFVYIPLGRFIAGYGRTAAHEQYRIWHEALPAHERETDAYLIARYETTFDQWIEFLDYMARCGDRDCEGLAMPAMTIEAEEEPLQLRLARADDGTWELFWRADDDHAGYRVREGQPFVYEVSPPGPSPLSNGRGPQDWGKFPVSGVSHQQVQIYLRWLRQVKGVSGAALCTEEQWERAARGADERRFPHGHGLASVDDVNIDETYGRNGTAYGPDAVGTHGGSESPFAVHDMAGNVWEMVQPTLPHGRQMNSAIFGRGGSFYHPAMNAWVFNQIFINTEQTLPYVGFRVCAPM